MPRLMKPSRGHLRHTPSHNRSLVSTPHRVTHSFHERVPAVRSFLMEPGMDAFAHDLVHAFRSIRRSPGFSLVVVLILALGIGASTAVFTLVDSILLRPLEYASPEQLVAIWERTPEGDIENPTSPANFFAWRERAKSFSGLAAWVDRPFSLAARGESAELLARVTTGDYFALLGTQALIGSTYLPAHESEDVAVLSYPLWKGRFAGDPNVIGETVQVNGEPTTVIGVMPAEFRSVGSQQRPAGAEPAIWLPAEFDPEWRGRWLAGLGRLKPGVTLEQAQAEMSAIALQLDEEFPERNRGWGINLVPLQDQATQGLRPALLVLLGAVGLLLLITCANVANLLLGRAASRRKEYALRLSLGASRFRLARRAVAESLVLALVGGLLGVALAQAVIAMVVRLVPPDLGLTRLQDVSIDPGVLGFALGVSVLTALLFGIAPALFASRVAPSETLAEASRGTTGGRSRLRTGLVIAEVAIAVVLLFGAGLLGRTLHGLLSIDTGIDPENVLTMRVTLADEKYAAESAVTGFTNELFERVEALPAVEAVGSITYLPLTGEWIGHSFWPADGPRPPEWEERGMQLRPISGRYFEAMGIPLRSGRVFDARDTAEAPAVFIVNEALVRRDFPTGDPIGQRIAFEWGEVRTGTIVGVVGDVRAEGPGVEPAAAVYVPGPQLLQPQMSLVVRTTGDPLQLARPIESIVREIDPVQPVARVRTMEDVVAATVARQRLTLWLLGGFAAMAILLAALGLYAIVSWSVTQRKREIGVRVALGAESREVMRLVAGQAGRMTAAGLALGVVFAAFGWRIMESLLFEVEPTDPVTILAVTLFLGFVALVASWLPAWRATRIEPAAVLREE